MELPVFFKPILWSFDFDRLSVEKNKKTIIINSINYGNLTHWRWISKIYGKEEVRKVLSIIPVTQIRKRVKPIAAIIFKIKSFNNEKRSINSEK